MQQQLLATPTQIPDDIARLAHEQKLGEPRSEYAVLTLARSWRWRYFILCSALCLDRSEMKETCLLLYENGQKLP